MQKLLDDDFDRMVSDVNTPAEFRNGVVTDDSTQVTSAADNSLHK